MFMVVLGKFHLFLMKFLEVMIYFIHYNISY